MANNDSLDVERGFSIIQNFYAELFGTLIPGSLFVGGLGVMVCGVYYVLTGINIVGKLFAVSDWAPVVAFSLLFISLSYIAGAVSFRRDPTPPDIRGALHVWDNNCRKKKVPCEVVMFNDQQANEGGGWRRSFWRWFNIWVSPLIPFKSLSTLDCFFEESETADRRFPYPYLRTYLYSRGQRHLMKYVRWCQAMTNQKEREDVIVGARSKTMINIRKNRLETFGSTVIRLSMTKFESQIRMMTGIWYEAISLIRLSWLFVILFLLSLVILNCFRSDLLYGALTASSQTLGERSLLIGVLICLLDCICFLAYYRIPAIVHDQRRREALMILEYTKIMEDQSSEFRGFATDDEGNSTFNDEPWYEFCKKCNCFYLGHPDESGQGARCKFAINGAGADADKKVLKSVLSCPVNMILRNIFGLIVVALAAIVVDTAVKEILRDNRSAEAATKYLASAEKGDARAQFEIALSYEEGDGVEKNAAEAVKWYRKAAEQGHMGAQFNLGSCYHEGAGVAKDSAEAVKWWRKAADQGLAQAQFNLGNSYKNGDGIEENAAEAMKWWRKAAEQGHVSAQLNLALCCEKGDGVERNQAEAVKWYFIAAKQGNADAQFNFGLCCAFGKGRERNMKEAVKWFRRAAERGHAQAQFNLGGCYEHGEGVEKIRDEAVKWYCKAAAQGVEQAKQALVRLGVGQ